MLEKDTVVNVVAQTLQMEGTPQDQAMKIAQANADKWLIFAQSLEEDGPTSQFAQRQYLLAKIHEAVLQTGGVPPR